MVGDYRRRYDFTVLCSLWSYFRMHYLIDVFLASCGTLYFLSLEKTCGSDGIHVQCSDNKKSVDGSTPCTSCDDNECCEGTLYLS